MSEVSTNGGLVRLKIIRITAIWSRMSLRPLFATLIALAMLFAPLAVSSGSAMAMAPSTDHHAQAKDSGHCGEQPAEDKHAKPDDSSCCVAMCTAIAVAPTTPIEPQMLASSTERPTPSQFHRSFLAKLPTPPPRLA